MFPLNVRYQVSHPYRTTGKLIVLNIPIFKFSTATEKTEGSGPNGVIVSIEEVIFGENN
jgi:hypothetical protein